MPIGMIFWMLMIFWAIVSFVYVGYPDAGPYRRHIFGGWGLLTFILFFILGWRVFGFVIQG